MEKKNIFICFTLFIFYETLMERIWPKQEYDIITFAVKSADLILKVNLHSSYHYLYRCIITKKIPE